MRVISCQIRYFLLFPFILFSQCLVCVRVTDFVTLSNCTLPALSHYNDNHYHQHYRTRDQCILPPSPHLSAVSILHLSVVEALILPPSGVTTLLFRFHLLTVPPVI